MSFNDDIRRAARHEPLRPPGQPSGVGQLGIGRGGACQPPRPRPVSEQINEQIRQAANVIRGRISLDDVLGVSPADVIGPHR